MHRERLTRAGKPLAWLMLMVLAFYVPQLVAGTTQADGVDVHYASQRYFSDAIRSGHLPFWTPYIFSGFPFLADLQIGAWYPLNWPFFLAGITPASISRELFVHALVACSGAYLLALRWIGDVHGALASAVFYGLSGYFAGHAQHVGIFETAAWLPWLLLTLGLIRERLTVRRLVLAGLIGGALALPGHFQTALYTFSGVAVWAGLESACVGSWRVARRFAAGMLVVGVWGALLSSVMILPALELASRSLRTRINAFDSDIGYFHVDSLLTLVQPNYYGLLVGRYTGPGDVTQHFFYAGLLLVPLAVLGLGHARARRTAAFLGLPFLWYALGPTGGLFRLVARLPGFDSVELPMHGWFLPALSLALLAGAGLAKARARFRPKWIGVVALGWMIVDVFIFNSLFNPLVIPRFDSDQRYFAPVRQASDALGQVQRLYGAENSAIGYRNHALQNHVETTYGYNPLELAAYTDYVDAAAANGRLVDGLAATHTLEASGAIEPHPTALPVVYFARSITYAGDDASATSRLADLDPSAETIVIGPRLDIQPDPSATANVVQRGDDFLMIHYRSPSPNLLRIAIPAYPGWHAQRDGVDLPIVTVDHALLGVVVPAGDADIRLQYRPRFFWWGAAISGLTLLVSVALLSLRRR